MSVQRIIPVLLHKNGRLVLSRNFEMHHDVGDAFQIIERLKNWDVDELIYLDITPHWCLDLEREQVFEHFTETIEQVSKNCFVPLTVGGGITNIDQMQRLLRAGADRIVLCTAALENPELISEAAHTFGAQAVNICLDVRKVGNDYICYTRGGSKPLSNSPIVIAKTIEAHGAGEITIQAMHCDGQSNGYDLSLLSMIANAISIPVIALGGAGRWIDFEEPLKLGIGGVAAANIFTYQELSYKSSKEAILNENLVIRPGTLGIDYKAARYKSGKFSADKNELWLQLGQSGFME